jgi:hypothetical protein
METGLLVGVRTGVGALVLVALGVRVGAGLRVGVAGRDVGVTSGDVGVAPEGVLVTCKSPAGVLVGVVGTVTGVTVGVAVGDRATPIVGVALGMIGMTTATGGVGVPGNVLTRARKLK